MPIYRDFDFKFEKNQQNDINFKDDVEAIRQSLKDILFTRRGERVWRPTYGSNIPALLFEKVNLITALQIKEEIQIAIENWEPRVNIIRIECYPDPDNQLFNATIYYEIINLQMNDSLNLKLNILR